MTKLTLNEQFEWLKNNKPEGFIEQLGWTWEEFVEKDFIADLYSFSFNHPYYGGYSGMSDDEARHKLLDEIGVPKYK